MDICPTLDMYNATDQDFATNYFHWFFLIQPKFIPENFISKDPKTWLNYCLNLVEVDLILKALKNII